MCTLACGGPHCRRFEATWKGQEPTLGKVDVEKQNLAGRLPNDTYSHDYEVSLEEGDRLSVSVSDTSQPCSATIEVYAPTSQAFSHGQPVMTWTDGAAVSDAAGYP
ncbi:MAG: hypothetical protein R3A48_10985 [Polyangiales bacterium]